MATGMAARVLLQKASALRADIERLATERDEAQRAADECTAEITKRERDAAALEQAAQKLEA